MPPSSTVLQGYMYLTNSHLCFFAHIPAREDQVLKSGSLYKKTTRTKRWVKRWFILKNDVLSWYQTSSVSRDFLDQRNLSIRDKDPYFPHGVVDLRYAISCESVSDKDILLKTNQKIVLASADSSASRDEWVKAIQKVSSNRCG
jgi:sterol 3beta-glucosyltransferase